LEKAMEDGIAMCVCRMDIRAFRQQEVDYIGVTF
jgi:hypothetical protein